MVLIQHLIFYISNKGNFIVFLLVILGDSNNLNKTSPSLINCMFLINPEIEVMARCEFLIINVCMLASQFLPNKYVSKVFRFNLLSGSFVPLTCRLSTCKITLLLWVYIFHFIQGKNNMVGSFEGACHTEHQADIILLPFSSTFSINIEIFALPLQLGML